MQLKYLKLEQFHTPIESHFLRLRSSSILVESILPLSKLFLRVDTYSNTNSTWVQELSLVWIHCLFEERLPTGPFSHSPIGPHPLKKCLRDILRTCILVLQDLDIEMCLARTQSCKGCSQEVLASQLIYILENSQVNKSKLKILIMNYQRNNFEIFEKDWWMRCI